MTMKIPGPTLLGFGDFFEDVFVGGPTPAKTTTKTTGLTAKTAGLTSKAKPQVANTTRANLPPGKTVQKAAIRYTEGKGKPSPARLALSGAVSAGNKALNAAKKAKASVQKYKKDAKSGKHGPLVKVAPTQVRGDGLIVLGAATKALTPQQKAAVTAHAKAIGKNAMAARRLNIAASKAQKAGSAATAFVQKATPLVRQKLSGAKIPPGKFKKALLGAAMLGEEDLNLDVNVDAGTDQELNNQSGAGGVDPSSGMVFAPDGSVLYDPSQDPEIVAPPERGQPLSADQASQTFRKVPEDGIPYDGSRDRMAGGVPYASQRFWAGVGGYYFQPANGKWYRREGGGEGADYKDYECTGEGDRWPRTGNASVEQGFGPLIGNPNSELKGLQFAVDDKKWFWQGAHAPSWAAAEIDAAINLANKKTMEANQSAALVQLFQMQKDGAEQAEAQRKQDAANALALSAADTQAQIADKAVQAQKGQLEVLTQKTELDLTAQQTTADIQAQQQQAQMEMMRQQMEQQERAAEIQLMQQQAQIDAAAQQALIAKTQVWNDWAKAHPEEAVRQMQGGGAPYEDEGYYPSDEGEYEGGYDGSGIYSGGGGYDFGGEEDYGEPLEDD